MVVVLLEIGDVVVPESSLLLLLPFDEELLLLTTDGIGCFFWLACKKINNFEINKFPILFQLNMQI